LFLGPKTEPDDRKHLIKKFEETAISKKKYYKHYVISGQTNKSTHLYKDFANALDIKEDTEFPMIVLCTHTINFHFVKYKYTGVINKFNIITWIDNVRKGLAPEYFKTGKPLSEEEQEENYVKSIVMSEFDSKVKGNI